MSISRTIVVSLLVFGAAGFCVGAQAALAGAPITSPSQQQQDFVGILAKAELTQQGITPRNTSQADYRIALNAAIRDIQAQRSAGLGWGAIAKQMGLNWGKVVSDARHARNAARESGQHHVAMQAQNKNADRSNLGNGGNGGNGGGGHGGQGGGGKK